jgi:hypothetical protein
VTRNQIIDLVERRYFGSVTRGDVAATGACFTADAVITILHGDNPPRILQAAPDANEAHISEFWRHLCANYDARFDQFEHFIDESAARCAATFAVTLTPKPLSPHYSRGVLRLRNCNFFWLRNDLIEAMTVYYANPDTGGDALGKPTGYPPR